MVDPHAFTPETSRVSMLENISSEGLVPLGLAEEPAIDHSAVRRLVLTFLTVVRMPLFPPFSSPLLLTPRRRAV